MQRNATDDSALAARVPTLQEAAELALASGLSEDCLFVFARAIKAFEATTGNKLPRNELANALSVWWGLAKQKLPADANFDEYLLLLENAYDRAKSPLGSNALEIALKRVENGEFPQEANAFESPRLKRLVAICWHLQRLTGSSAFFLSLRDCARLLGITRLEAAQAFLSGLVKKGILSIEKKGTPGGRRATRFRYHSLV